MTEVSPVVDDPSGIVPDANAIRMAVLEHPLGRHLPRWVARVNVQLHPHEWSSGAMIDYCADTRTVTLSLVRRIPCLPEYRYILLHEFTHVADKTDPAFLYSDAKRFSLPDQQQRAVAELWNIYIDGRLHKMDLFELGECNRNVTCEVDGDLQVAPFTIEGKLLGHIHALRGMSVTDPDAVVRGIWESPGERSYEELIAVACAQTEGQSIAD